MTDPDQDLGVGDDPSSLAAEASGGESSGSTGSTGSTAGAEASMGGPPSEPRGGLVSAFFETDPAMSPESVRAPQPVAEAVVGVRKFLNGLGVETGDGGDGTPAIVHFVRAAVGFGQLRAGDEPDQPDQPEAEGGSEPVESDEPRGPQT